MTGTLDLITLHAALNGAALFDSHPDVPDDWRGLIRGAVEGGRFDMEDGCECAVGTTMGHFVEGMPKLGLRLFGPDSTIHGFYWGDSAGEDEELFGPVVASLERAWAVVVGVSV